MHTFLIVFTKKLLSKIYPIKKIESNLRTILNKIRVLKPLELRPRIGRLSVQQNFVRVGWRKEQTKRQVLRHG